MKLPSFLRSGFLVSALILGVISVAKLSAQTTTPISVGTTVLGTITVDGETSTYTFDGRAGDLVTLRVFALTPGMDPNITLLGPIQEPLFSQEYDSFAPTNASAAGNVARLFVTGPYTITVGGTVGDFVLTTEVQPAIRTLVLVPDEPRTLTVPFANNPIVFAFNTDPMMSTSLHMVSAPENVNTHVEVRDGTGQITALFLGGVNNHCVSLAPGDELFTATLNTGPEEDGSLTLTLSNRPCVVDTEAEAAAPSTQTFNPLPIEGACAASSVNNVNIRSGPGFQFPIIALWRVGAPIQVVGRSEDGNWFVVQSSFGSGWMSSRAVGITGPCDGLPVTASDAALPTQDATAVPPQTNATPLIPATAVTVQPTTRPTTTPRPTATTVPPTAVPPTDVPPTTVPPTEVPPTDIPPTQEPPTEIPPTDIPPTQEPPTSESTSGAEPTSETAPPQETTESAG